MIKYEVRGRHPFSVLLAVCLALGLTSGFAIQAESAEPKHGLSAFGELKYPANFEHFDYVNPDAPKGGKLTMVDPSGNLTFNTLNGFILKGEAAAGLEFLFDSLMTRAEDEPDAVYALVAKSAELADDGKSIKFFLNENAKFSDGSALTAADVVKSFQLLKEHGRPEYTVSLRDVKEAVALDDSTVEYRFEGDLTRDLPMLVAQLPIFSKAYYETHDFEKTTLDPPLGSGPYKVEKMEQGRFISYKLRDDYWAKDLPVNKGRYNFSELRFEYFRDYTSQFEALKKGIVDLREEYTAKTWMTEYDFEAVKKGNLIKTTLPDERPSGAQGFFLNQRRAKFQDPRVREAIGLVFDYEWTNKNIFFNLYKRTTSFFENSDMEAEGKASEEEMAILSKYMDDMPPAYKDEPISPPVTDASGRDRKMFKRASELLSEAGWEIKEGKLLNAKGETLDIEIIFVSTSWKRVIGPFAENLKRLGINAYLKQVDSSQYEKRRESFDYDIITQRYVISNTPGVELRNYWNSATVDKPGSRNLGGINDPLIDQLVEEVIAAKSREELNTATRALDRALRAGHHWIPHWYRAFHTMAFWNKFSWPDVKPKYGRGIVTTWWYDKEKADSIKK